MKYHKYGPLSEEAVQFSKIYHDPMISECSKIEKKFLLFYEC